MGSPQLVFLRLLARVQMLLLVAATGDDSPVVLVVYCVILIPMEF